MKYVLVVDDDKVVNLLIARELQKKGYGVFMSYDAVRRATAGTEHSGTGTPSALPIRALARRVVVP